MKSRMIKTTLALSLAACTQISFAGYTAVNGVATRAQSMQAFVGVADDPSAIYYNPAGITQVEGTQVDTSGVVVFTDQDYNNSGVPGNPSTNSSQIPYGANVFMTTDKVSAVHLGLGVYAPFARDSKYDINGATYDMKHYASITRIDLAPTLAMDINEYVSVGLGPVLSHVTERSSIMGVYTKGKGQGYTGQAGVLFKLPHQIKIGLSYLGKEHSRTTGNGEMTGSDDAYTMYLNFPDIYRIGASWQINEKWFVSAGYELEGWSYLKKVKYNYTDPTLASVGEITVDGKDSSNYRIGVDYKPNDNNEFMAGYSYVEAAVPTDYIIPAKPDYNVNYFSIGYSHYINAWRFDAGYEFGISSTRETSSVLFPGDYKVQVSCFSLGISYNFDK